MARLVLALLLAVLAGSALCGYYTYKVDPETQFVTAAMRLKIDQAAELDKSDASKIVLVGGSSCAFSLSPQLLGEEFGLAAVNMGIPASTGRAFQLDQALRACSEGDLLVLAFETPFWSKDADLRHEGIGCKVHWRLGDRSSKQHAVLPFLGLDDDYPIIDRRPGLRNVATVTLKKMLRRPDFRYSPGDVDAFGYMTTDYSEGDLLPEVVLPAQAHLSPPREQLLQRIIRYCESIDCEVAVSVPWLFVAQENLQESRSRVAALQAELGAFCSVLEDHRLGAEVDAELFSDTGWHLSRRGAVIRTRQLGVAIGKRFPHRSAGGEEKP